MFIHLCSMVKRSANMTNNTTLIDTLIVVEYLVTDKAGSKILKAQPC